MTLCTRLACLALLGLAALGCDDDDDASALDGSPTVDATADATADAASPDAASPDAASPDAASPDATADAASPDAAVEVWEARRILTDTDGLLVPDGMAVLPSGNLLLCNEGTSQLLEIALDPPSVVRVVADRAGGLRAPEEVALGRDGRIYISDDSAQGVFELEDDGTLTRLLGVADGLTSPEGVAVDDDGTVYVADEKAHVVLARAPDGTVRTLATEADGVYAPEGMILGPAGELFATDDRRGGVLAVSTEGGARVLIPATELKLPEGIAMDALGTLWITDNAGQATLNRYDLTGRRLLSVVVPMPAGDLSGVAALPDGRVAFGQFRAGERHALWLLERR